MADPNITKSMGKVHNEALEERSQKWAIKTKRYIIKFAMSKAAISYKHDIGIMAQSQNKEN